MLYNSKKFFLFLLSLCAALPIYAMEECNTTQNLNKDLWDAVESAQSENYRLYKTLNETNSEEAQEFQQQHLRKIQKLLEKGANPNSQNQDGFYSEGLLHFVISKSSNQYDSAQFDTQIIETLLKHGADSNMVCGNTPLEGAINYKMNHFIPLLIQHKANVNKMSGAFSPLYMSIQTSNKQSKNDLTTVQILCNNKASLINMDPYFQNALHLAVRYEAQENYLRALLIHACFDSYKPIINQDQRWNLIRTICALKKWSGKYPEGYIGLPLEIQDKIIAYFPIEYFQDPDKLCRRLLNQGYKHPYVFAQTNKQVALLSEIMRTSDSGKKTPLDRLRELEKRKNTGEKWKYVDPENGILTSDMALFKQNFPGILNSEPGKNILCDIYNKHKALCQ